MSGWVVCLDAGEEHRGPFTTLAEAQAYAAELGSRDLLVARLVDPDDEPRGAGLDYFDRPSPRDDPGAWTE
jgi:hypothetical protein